MTDAFMDYTPEWEAARDAAYEATRRFREATIAEIGRLLPDGGEVVSMYWSQDYDHADLKLLEIRDTAGVVIWDEDTDELDAGLWQAIDTLCNYLVDDYYDADSWFLKDPEREGGEHFIIDYTTTLEGTDQ